MNFLRDDLQEWATEIFKEIASDTSDFYHPASKNHQIFNQAYMKFVNRNLNYFDYANMVVTALYEDPEYNPNLKKTLEFCNYIKKLTGKEDDPFGRMCVWDVPARHTILPHIDNFIYHTMIDRYIFFVSEHPVDTTVVNIDFKRVKSDTGSLFEFSPTLEVHEFINNSDSRMIFLGFDIWKSDKLRAMSNNINIDAVTNNPERLGTFGAQGKKSKYMSKH